MKTIYVWGLAAIALASCNPSGSALNEDAVREFAVSHIENQVGYEAAVEGFYAGLSSELKVWNNPVWKNTPKDYEVDPDDDGSYFYEDSIKVTLHDVYMMGGYANVMGTIQWYIAGVNTGHRNFSGIITDEGGKLKWTRFVGIDHNQLSSGFLWPSTEMEGALDAYKDMRVAMMNLDNEVALALSDSLVEADPNWATAHLGQLHYYWMNKDVDNFESAYEMAVSKFEGASRAEKHFIQSYTVDRVEGRKHLEQAMLFAPADPMIRTWYAWGERDADRALEIMDLAWKRLPNNGGVNNMLGYKHMAAGNMDKAKQHFEIFMRTSPDVPNAYDSYGDYYLKAGDTAKAKAMYMSAYEMNNNWTNSKEKAEEL